MPWTTQQKLLISLTALAIVFDGVDNQLLGVAIPSIAQEWNITRAAFAPVISIGYFGMMIGGAMAGLAGDRFGRRSALLASLMLFGGTTALIALVSDTSQLALLRLLAGAGLGGAIPNATTLAAEYVPVRSRPIAVTLTIVCVPVGGTIAGLLGVRLLPATAKAIALRSNLLGALQRHVEPLRAAFRYLSVSGRHQPAARQLGDRHQPA